MQYSYRTQGTCSSQINFELDGDKVKNISFIDGCNGNLKAISKLCDGMSVEKIVDLLKGNDCSGRGTSCADQLATAVELAYKESAKGA